MRRCLILLLAITAVSFQGCTMWKERPARTWAEATGGEGLERNFWKEVRAKNWLELERHLGGTYVSVTPQGSFNRAASLDRLRQLELSDYSLGDFLIELNGTTMIVTYTITMKGTFNGSPLTAQPLRVMSVWQQHKSGWMTIAHSAVENEPK
jgi:hypothetical protein